MCCAIMPSLNFVVRLFELYRCLDERSWVGIEKGRDVGVAGGESV